jgi:hypothetical protein
MTKAIWVRRGRCFYPASDEAEEQLRSTKDGAEVFGEFKAPRNIKNHRLYWALMKILVDHNVFPSLEAASDVVKIACGHVDMRIAPDTGEVFMAPKSISFASMPQAEFKTFFDTAIRQICARWLQGTDDEALKAECYLAIDGAGAIGERVPA